MRKDLTPFGRFNHGMSIFDEFDRIFGSTFANMIPAKQQDNYPVAEKSTEDEEKDENKYIVRRFAKRAFSKQYDLGELYDPDSAQADFTDGVLTLTFTKKVIEEPESTVKRLEI